MEGGVRFGLVQMSCHFNYCCSLSVRFNLSGIDNYRPQTKSVIPICISSVFPLVASK